MDWHHSVDKKWLEARRSLLTASEIVKLIPVTATGRPRSKDVLVEAALKIYGSKLSEVDENDVTSSGVMARGHIMEPYAIELINKLGRYPMLHHWDDCIIQEKSTDLGFSPDGLDVEQLDGCPVHLPATSLSPKTVVEIKSFDAGSHYLNGLAQKMTLENRWQLAVAMAVLPTVTTGVLAYFNPKAQHPLFIHEYTPNDLKDEIEMIQEAVKFYYKTVTSKSLILEALCPQTIRDNCPTEEEIISLTLALEQTPLGMPSCGGT